MDTIDPTHLTDKQLRSLIAHMEEEDRELELDLARAQTYASIVRAELAERARFGREEGEMALSGFVFEHLVEIITSAGAEQTRS